MAPEISSLSIKQPSMTVVYSIDEEDDSKVIEEVAGAAASYIPPHPLGVKPMGNQYSATLNSKRAIGLCFQSWPDEILALFLESLGPDELIRLGSTCKFLYAFCRADDIWKSLFIA